MYKKPVRIVASLALILSFAGLSAIGADTSKSVVQGEPIEGIVTVLNGDPHPASGRAARRIYVLSTDDGRRFELDLSGATLPASGLAGIAGRRMRAVAAAPWASSNGFAPPVRVVELAPLESVAGLATAKISGPHPFVTLLCRFADDPAEPRAPAFFLAQLGTTAPGFNHYFREVSYGTINLDGSAVAPAWVALPHPRSFYIAAGKPSSTFLDELFKDCTGAASTGIDFSRFYGINLMFNGKLDDAAWGGQTPHTLNGLNKAWPSTWMPYLSETDPFGWRNHSILAHEMAHAFGAPHSESPDGDEYGSSWDVVSSPGVACAITDPSYGCLGQSMNAYAKVTMQMISPGLQAVATSGTQAYTIDRLTQPTTPGGTVLLRVNIAGTTTRFYTVESRFRIGYDAQLPGNGVIIHVVDTTKDRQARIVSQGGNGAGLGGVQAIWPVGSTFTSPADNVSIRVDSLDTNGVARVTVSSAATAGLAASDNASGLWWNAAESGWGLNLNQQGTTLFATLFNYDVGAGLTNRPLWLVLPAGVQQADGSFRGALYQTTGPAFNASPFTPIGATNLAEVGTMQITFLGKAQATLQYTVNGTSTVKNITPQAFGPLQTCTNVAATPGGRVSRTNYTDLWWVPSESGWGVNVTQQGSTLFATLFTYEAGTGTSNRGVWLVMSAGARQSDGTFLGDLYQTTGPAFNADPFTPIGGSNVTKVGTMRFRFADGEHGTLTYDVNGASVTKSIVPQTFGSQLPSCN